MNGFIPGSRASFMLDVVAVAMFVAIPVLTIGIQKAKKRSYQTHKTIMLSLSAVLLAAVILFEIEMRLIGWEHLAQSSQYYGPVLFTVLGVHLFFSVSTTIALAATTFLALRKFPSPPSPSAHSRIHKKIGMIAAVGLFVTSVTGWVFYWMAFIS